MPTDRTFILKDKRELTTTLAGKAKTFRFPYTTSDEQEIQYLLSRGATIKKSPIPLLQRSPVMPKVQDVPKVQTNESSTNFKPLKGGEEK